MIANQDDDEVPVGAEPQITAERIEEIGERLHVARAEVFQFG